MKKAALSALILLVFALACRGFALGEGSSVVPEKGYEAVDTLDIVYTPADAPAITVQMHEGQAYLFLPSGAQVEALTIGGKSVPCTLTEGENTIRDALGKTLMLTVMQSANLRSVYLVSEDAENAGRAFVEANNRHTTVVQAELTIVNAQGKTDYRGVIQQLRGRGNTTWWWGAKKPYQLKLEKKADLLQNGHENRTFLLLAECFDATLLHNTLCLDIAQKLGLPSPAFEPVDLYYDGVYRGTYLLCEKVEVRSGLLDILNYNDLLSRQYDAENLPVLQADNRYGCPYQYLDGVDADNRENGAYLLEIDQYFYTTEDVWVSTASDLHFTVQNPGCLSKADGAYIGEFLQRIENALQNGGVEPETGQKVSDLLDFQSLAQFFLLSEWSKNPDYWRGSTFFYKPAGEEKLYAGPVWDFDIAFGIREGESGTTGYLRADEGWLGLLCAMPDFQETVRAVWENELEPMLSALDLDAYMDRVAGSAAMNFTLWPYGGGYNNINKDTVYGTWTENLDFLRDYLTGRLEWMNGNIAGWAGHTVSAAALTLSYRNADVPACAQLTVTNSRNNVALSDVQWQTAPDTAVPWHNLYTVTATLTVADSCKLAEGFAVTINGDPVTQLSADTRTAKLRFSFSAPKYESALYDGDDYGMLYQYDYFVAHNPDIVEECGTDDPAEMLDYFVSSGLYEELTGIETYVPEAFINNYYEMMDAYYMCDPESCAQYYRENVVKEDLLGMEQEAFPDVLP
ncbi:MAG: CotH kinase family protein [Eubacteriales bacterium]|nr:CotH kinase family protein [Eubacteriales bacterium]